MEVNTFGHRHSRSVRAWDECVRAVAGSRAQRHTHTIALISRPPSAAAVPCHRVRMFLSVNELALFRHARALTRTRELTTEQRRTLSGLGVYTSSVLKVRSYKIQIAKLINRKLHSLSLQM